jgi:hypothetical protein
MEVAMNRFALLQITTADGVSHWIHESDVEMVVTAHGYIEATTPYGKKIENILPFPKLVGAIEEERREWWREA